MGVGCQHHSPAALPPGKDPVPICIGGWVGPRAGLDGWRKSRPPPGFDPRTVQAVASRFTEKLRILIVNFIEYVMFLLFLY